MLTLEGIKARLQPRGINLMLVASESGVYYKTLLDIVSGKNENPTYKTLKALSDYLEARE